MRLLNKLFSRRSEPELKFDELETQLEYQKLESRRVLSATFAFGAGQLLLDGFDVGQDLAFAQQTETINGSATDAYVFDLSAGSWTGSTSNPGIEVESVNGGTDNQLQVATDLFGTAANSIININGATGSALNVDVDQLGSSFTTGVLNLSNITSVDSSLQLQIAGDVALDNIEVSDSNPNDAVTSAASLEVSATGDINVVGNLSNQMENVGAGITLATNGINSDIHVLGIVETISGSISIASSDTVVLGENAEVNSGQSGDIDISAGNDGVVDDDLSRIEFVSGAGVDAGSGTVFLDTSGGGDILLGHVTSNGAGTAIVITSGQSIFDNSADELANLSAVNGTINLSAADSIGTISNTADFFKALPGDHGLVELESRVVIAQATQFVGLNELTLTDTTFIVDGESVFLYSQGDLIFQNGNSPINELSLISEQSVILPEALSVGENLRIEAADQVLAIDSTIDLAVPNLLFQSGSSQTIRTAVNQMDAAVAGDLDVENTGDLNLIDLNCDLVAVNSTSSSGSITISSTADLTVSDDVIAGPLDGSISSGTIEFNATNIQVDDAVLTGEGSILLAANASIGIGTTGVVSTVGGNIDLRAEDEVLMLDGARVLAGRDTSTIYDPFAPLIVRGPGSFGGAIEVVANQDVTLASLETNNNSSAAVSIFTTNGSVLDGGDSDIDIIADQTGAS